MRWKTAQKKFMEERNEKVLVKSEVIWNDIWKLMWKGKTQARIERK